MKSRRKLPSDFRKILIFVTIFSFPCFSFETRLFGNDADLEKIRQYYDGIKGLDATILQFRYSKYLKKPVTSEVELRWNPESFIWKVTNPVPFTLISDKGIVKVNSDDESEFPQQVQQGIRQIIGFIEHLISADISALSQDFDLTFADHALTAIPKNNEKNIIKKPIKLTFQSDLSLKSIVIGAGVDRSELRVQKIKVTRK